MSIKTKMRRTSQLPAGSKRKAKKSLPLKSQTAELPAVPSLDPYFSEPMLSAGRTLAPQFGHGGTLVANCGGSVFIKRVEDHYIVCAHLRRGGWTLARDRVATLALAWKQARALATHENIGPSARVDWDALYGSAPIADDPEQQNSVRWPSV